MNDVLDALDPTKVAQRLPKEDTLRNAVIQDHCLPAETEVEDATISIAELREMDDCKIKEAICKRLRPERYLGLFKPAPRPRQLLRDSVPVLWLTLMALWPDSWVP